MRNHHARVRPHERTAGRGVSRQVRKAHPSGGHSPTHAAAAVATAAARRPRDGSLRRGSPASTNYHAQFWAYELSQRHGPGDPGRLSRPLADARVELNPHQVAAALFPFRSQLMATGALLADEVGLGKTVEAGLVISQLWAERKRRILCVVPTTIRGQWKQELADKFDVDSVVLDGATYEAAAVKGNINPFEQDGRVVICSHHFAYQRHERIKAAAWDLVVIDEAHRFRNVWKNENVMARAIRSAIEGQPKLLLTATPLHNNVMELFGVVSFIDPHLLGHPDAFAGKFGGKPTGRGGGGRRPPLEPGRMRDLKERLASVMTRTLRRDVLPYIRYTERHSMTVDFKPTAQEAALYQDFSDWLRRSHSHALPAGPRTLLILVLRKILASSSFALAGTLRNMADRLRAMLEGKQGVRSVTAAALFGDSEAIEGIDAGPEQEEGDGRPEGVAPTANATSSRRTSATRSAIAAADARTLRQEIAELEVFRERAESIVENAKGQALLGALERAFSKAKKLGGPRKVLIFTEFLGTQQYLRQLLEQNGYAGKVVTFNGTNDDAASAEVYQAWLRRNGNDDAARVRPAALNVRQALVEEFRDRAEVMIATEAAAEGVNLQFCSLVVNFDLPWNPQRVEQRIGRCHRYGQKHDVVVVNFINTANAADRRVFELLRYKLGLSLA